MLKESHVKLSVEGHQGKTFDECCELPDGLFQWLSFAVNHILRNAGYLRDPFWYASYRSYERTERVMNIAVTINSDGAYLNNFVLCWVKASCLKVENDESLWE